MQWNRTYLSDRVDVDIVLGVCGMRHERLDQEVGKHALDVLDFLVLQRLLTNPLAAFWPCLV